MTRRNKPLRTFLSRLRRDQRGGVALTFLLSTTVLLGGSFGAIDLIRYNVAQNRLQNSLDAAAISAGRNLANRTPTPGTPEAEAWVNDARNFFSSNMPDSYLGSSVQQDDLQIEYSEDFVGGYRTGQFVDMSVRGDLPLMSTGFFKITSFGLAATNQAIRRTRSDLEVVMVLDNTGSMANENRMTHLKTASKMLVDTVLGAAEANGNSRTFIGLVPFNHMINVGNTEHTRVWLTPEWQNHLFVTSNYWSGCITEPLIDGRPSADITASGVGVGNFTPLAATPQHTAQVLGVNNSRSSPRNLSTAARIVDGSQSAQFAADDRPYAYMPAYDPAPTRFQPAIQTARFNSVNQDALTSTFKINPNYCYRSTERRTMFMTNNGAELTAAIDDMTSHGWTLIPAGLLWGWRMLHPDWQGRWGGPSVSTDDGSTELLPRVAHPDLTKVMIVLTDGANDIGNSSSRSTSRAALNDDYTLRYQYQEQETVSTNVTSSYNTRRRCQNAGYRWQSISGGRCWRDETHWTDPQNATLTVREQDVDLSVSNVDRTFNALNDEAFNLYPSDIGSLDAYTRALCTNIRNPEISKIPGGIRIYTIALGSSITNSVRTLMTDCASPNRFYDSSNVNDLQQVFASIAGDLMELRLTK